MQALPRGPPAFQTWGAALHAAEDLFSLASLTNDHANEVEQVGVGAELVRIAAGATVLLSTGVGVQQLGWGHLRLPCGMRQSAPTSNQERALWADAALAGLALVVFVWVAYRVITQVCHGWLALRQLQQLLRWPACTLH